MYCAIRGKALEGTIYIGDREMKRLKEFELWFEKKKAGYSHAAYYTDRYEDGWKAALEWVLNHEIGDYDLDKIIKKELNAKT